MHFCKDELFALMAMIPCCGFLVHRVRAWWHLKFGCKNHHEVAE